MVSGRVQISSAYATEDRFCSGGGGVFGSGVENLRKRARGVNSIVLVQSQENLSRSLRARFPIEEIVQLWLATRAGPCVCCDGREKEKSLLNSRPVISTARAQNLQRDSRWSSSWSPAVLRFKFPVRVKAIGATRAPAAAGR